MTYSTTIFFFSVWIFLEQEQKDRRRKNNYTCIKIKQYQNFDDGSWDSHTT